MYNYSHIELCLKKVSRLFTTAFIKLGTEELILESMHNIYFRLDNINEIIDFDCKIIAYLSRPAHKGLSKQWHSYFKERLNKYFGKNWTEEELSLIYTYLGNDVNRKLCKKFILSSFDLHLLRNKGE